MSNDSQQSDPSPSQRESPTVVRLATDGIVFELARIPPGQFWLGSPQSEPGRRSSEGPRQRVTLSQAFYMGRYEVTQAQYVAIMGENPSEFVGDELAVDQVSFSAARAFCERLSERLGVPVTLPTEAQWEYACRAGTETRFHSGDAVEDLDRVGWYRDNAGGTVHPVGIKAPNAWGLYDMHGNVWELCLDVLPPYDALADLTDPVGELDEHQGSMRGGGWMHDADDCRAATSMRSNDRFGGTGVRLVVNLPDLADYAG